MLFNLIWVSRFREYTNTIFHQNMTYLHNRYKSAERKQITENHGIYVKLHNAK